MIFCIFYPSEYSKEVGIKMKTPHEPRIMGGGDPLLLKVVMTLLMPIFWIIDLFKMKER